MKVGKMDRRKGIVAVFPCTCTLQHD